MVQICCVRSCRSRAFKGSNRSYHKFPTEEPARSKWLQLVGLPEISLLKNKDLRVCSKHFMPTDYIHGVKKLKKIAVPNVMPEITHTQPSKRQPLFSFEEFQNSNQKTLFYTGFQTFQILYAMFQFILPSVDVRAMKMYNSSTEQQYLLTLFRLRRGFDYKTLGDMFNFSTSTAKKIFLCWINAMYRRFAQLNIWPHRDVLIENTPTDFQKKFKNVVGNIDCIKFYVQTPLAKPSHDYSNNKGSTNLKALLMTDPIGTIIYMSPLFTDSISDKAIIQNSGFIAALKQKLEANELLEGDIILADRGFTVASLLKDVNIEINIPIFKTKRGRFTEDEVQDVRHIAQGRIHVERTIRRLKKYELLNGKIPISLLGSIQQIYTVACVLSIFRNKLIKH